MAWEWSHSAEGVQNVMDNIAKMDREKLNVIYAEWKAKTENELHEAAYKVALTEAQSLDSEALVQFIQEKTEEYRTCSNGGFEAYCCPFDCGCHTVPFDATDENGDEIKEPEEE